MFRYKCTVLLSVLAVAHHYAAPVQGFNPLVAAAATLSPPGGKAATTAGQPGPGAAPPSTVAALQPILEPKDVVTRVAVAGATGRTGRAVVEELLARGITDVVALTRDETYAAEVFPEPPENLQLIKCDLSNERQVKKGTYEMNYVCRCLKKGAATSRRFVLLHNLKKFFEEKCIQYEGVHLISLCLTLRQLSPLKL